MIAGAGVIGLSCALQLRKRGCRVAVLDRKQPMREASWAAAGMLAARDPENPSALQALAERSLALYSEYLDEIFALCGHRVPLRTATTLQAVTHASSTHPVSPFGQWLTEAQARSEVPGLNTAHHRFLALAEASLDPRDLCLALPLAAAAAGVEIHAGLQVTGITGQHHSVEVETRAGRFSADAFLNCCGAWAAQLAHLPLEDASALPVRPRKGQMAVVQIDPHALSVVLRSPEVYLVPRGDGRLIVGASVEDAGFDTTVNPATVRSLLAKGAGLWPQLAAAPVAAAWAGLRPGTEDGLPLLGPMRRPRCFVASGHFRNGILLAPATAELMTALLLGEPATVEIARFAPERSLLAA